MNVAKTCFYDFHTANGGSCIPPRAGIMKLRRTGNLA